MARKAVAGLAIGLRVATAQAAPVVIDNFTSGGGAINNTSPHNSTFIGLGHLFSSALGGSRDWVVNNGAYVFSSRMTITTAQGKLSYVRQVSPPVNTTTFLLRWDGNNNGVLNASGLGGLDILGAGVSGISFAASNGSTALQRATFRAYSHATDFSDGVLDIPVGAVDTPLYLGCSSFTTAGGLARRHPNGGG